MITSTLVHRLVDEALKLDVDTMKTTELVLARINDCHEHVFQNELDRLRRGTDAKIEAQTLRHSVMHVNTHGGTAIVGGRFESGIEFETQKINHIHHE